MKQTDKQTNRQTDKETNRQTDRQTDKQTNRQTLGHVGVCVSSPHARRHPSEILHHAGHGPKVVRVGYQTAEVFILHLLGQEGRDVRG